MAQNRIIWSKNNVEYLSIRKAMTSGARTVNEETGEACGKCMGLIQNVIDLER